MSKQQLIVNKIHLDQSTIIRTRKDIKLLGNKNSFNLLMSMISTTSMPKNLESLKLDKTYI